MAAKPIILPPVTIEILSQVINIKSENWAFPDIMVLTWKLAIHDSKTKLSTNFLEQISLTATYAQAVAV